MQAAAPVDISHRRPDVGMWHSYLINLAKNTARLENSRRQFEEHGIPFSVIPAVNGWELDDQTLAKVYDPQTARRRFKHDLTHPEIGCYLSHIDAWRKIAEGEEAGGFVFEDDFKIISPLAEILNQLTRQPETGAVNWDVVKLFSLKEHPRKLRATPLIEGYELVVPYQVPTCLLGYGIRREAARRLLEQAIPVFRPVDEDLKYFWEKKISVSLVCPSPVQVGDQQSVTGTVGESRRENHRASFGKQLARSFRSLRYQLAYKLKLHYHRRIRRQA